MEVVLVVLGVAGWACAVVAAFLGRGSHGIREDTDGAWYVDADSKRGPVLFWLALLGATVGLASMLLVLA